MPDSVPFVAAGKLDGPSVKQRRPMAGALGFSGPWYSPKPKTPDGEAQNQFWFRHHQPPTCQTMNPQNTSPTISRAS